LSTASSKIPEENPPELPSRMTVVTIAETVKSSPGLARLLAKDPTIPVVSCSAGSEVAAVCRQLNPCVLIAEISLIDELSFALLTGKDASEGSISLLAIVDQDDVELSKRLLRMGVSGAVQRSAPYTVYRRALRAVAAGELWASRGTVSALLRELLVSDKPRKLTERETEILDLIADGHQNRQIADLLFISRETVRWHVRTMYKKIGVVDRTQAIAFARAAKGITPVKPTQKASASSKTFTVPVVLE
jgi:DNA-binding NarL/FixJ family response regulator